MVIFGHLLQIGLWVFLIYAGYGLWRTRDRGGAE